MISNMLSHPLLDVDQLEYMCTWLLNRRDKGNKLNRELLMYNEEDLRNYLVLACNHWSRIDRVHSAISQLQHNYNLLDLCRPEGIQDATLNRITLTRALQGRLNQVDKYVEDILVAMRHWPSVVDICTPTSCDVSSPTIKDELYVRGVFRDERYLLTFLRLLGVVNVDTLDNLVEIILDDGIRKFSNLVIASGGKKSIRVRQPCRRTHEWFVRNAIPVLLGDTMVKASYNIHVKPDPRGIPCGW